MPNTAIPIQSNEIDWFFVLECRQADSQPVFQDQQSAGYPAYWIAGMQKSKIAGMLESMTACYQNFLPV